MAKKNSTTSVLVHSTGSLRPRRLRARRRGHSLTLLEGALDLGLVAGDAVHCITGPDGQRHVRSLGDLRPGTLGQITVDGLCPDHHSGFIHRAKADLRAAGAVSVHARDGVLHSFWPADLPHREVALALAGSAGEYGFLNSLILDPDRARYINYLVELGPSGIGRATA